MEYYTYTRTAQGFHPKTKMKTFIIVSTILNLSILSHASKSLDNLKMQNNLEEKEMFPVLQNNQSFIFNVINLSNYKISVYEDMWSNEKEEIFDTNPYYENFSREIDLEAHRLLQIVPSYDPAAGNVSAECKRHSDIFHKELAKFTLWALQMYDATAKVSSGLLSGNINQLGDFDECIGVKGKDGIHGQYCLAHMQLNVNQSRPDLKYLHRLVHSNYVFHNNISDSGHVIPRFCTVKWAVCIPASCTTKDVKTSLQYAISKYTAQTGLEITVQVNEDMCQVKKEKFQLPRATILTGFFFTTMFIVTIIAAYYDHYKISASEVFLSFSLKRNYQKLFSLERSPDDIPSLHGIRFLNHVLLILAHKSMALLATPYINRTYLSEVLGKSVAILPRLGCLYTETFIMMSALLTTHSFMRELKKSGTLNIKKEYASRLLRIVPSLAVLILFCTHIMPYIGSGPQWNLVVKQQADICKKTWWRSLLFIPNYFGFENMCLMHTHHLGVDMQLFALSPLMVLFLYKKPKIGAIVLGIIALLSTVLRLYVTYNGHLNNFIHYSASIKQLLDTVDFTYTLPSHRLTVYIIGIFGGYFLQHVSNNFKLSTTFLYIGWIVSIMMFWTAHIELSEMTSINYEYNPKHAAIYNAFAPIGWCTLFLWIIIINHTGNSNEFFNRLFAWRGFLVTTRLSYSFYLTQIPVFIFNIGQSRAPEHFEIFRIIVNFKELLWIIFVSIILTLFFEIPFQNIRNSLFQNPVFQKDVTKASKMK